MHFSFERRGAAHLKKWSASGAPGPLRRFRPIPDAGSDRGRDELERCVRKLGLGAMIKLAGDRVRGKSAMRGADGVML